MSEVQACAAAQRATPLERRTLYRRAALRARPKTYGGTDDSSVGMRLLVRRILILTLALPALALVPPADAVGFGKNIEWVGTVPLTNDSPGGRRVGDYFYVTTSTALHILDIRDPANPVRTGVLQFTQTPQGSQEDVDTNGKVLLVGTRVVDVTNKAEPKLLGNHGVTSHTISCVLDCTWAYASNGRIIDLRNPADPKASTFRWTAGMPVSNSHDVTEVSPGIVMTSSDPILMLDARMDPEHPILIGRGPNRNRFTHGNLWPQQTNDRFLLVHGEQGNSPAPGACDDPSAHFVTMDATKGHPTYDDQGNITKLGEFSVIDEYRVGTGLPSDGQSPANAWCTHWADEHPAYANGGLVAMAWYEHGVRMLDIKPDGQIEEAGWYVPLGASTSGVYWITDRIMYTTDYQRGMDILRYTGPIPAAA